MALSRRKEDWSTLLNEYNICKKKLESKREALKILMINVEQAQVQRDIYRNKLEQSKGEVNRLKGIISGFWDNNNNQGFPSPTGETDKKYQTLNRLLQYSHDENECLRNDLKNIQEFYQETQKDNQLLRETLTKYEVHKKDNVEEKQGKEKLISQLEDAHKKVEQARKELEIVVDEKSEIEEEWTKAKARNERLNKELNYVLHNDDRRIVDVDSLILENTYLKEVVKQYKEEKAAALLTASQYKDALNSQNPKASGLNYLDLSTAKQGGRRKSNVTSRDHDITGSKMSAATACQLQQVNKALTEKLSEKETTLKHQRNTNRVLGTRVAELEKKLKTLEISGLWTSSHRAPYQGLSLETELFNEVQNNCWLGSPTEDNESPSTRKESSKEFAESSNLDPGADPPISNELSYGSIKNINNDNNQ